VSNCNKSGFTEESLIPQTELHVALERKIIPPPLGGYPLLFSSARYPFQPSDQVAVDFGLRSVGIVVGGIRTVFL